MQAPQVGDELGRYRIDQVIGQGGMGVVFAATDQRLGRTVALKVITGPLAQSEEFRTRFHGEADVLSRLDSPHVITIHDHDEVDSVPFIVTQFVDGSDLSTLLHEHGPMTARAALQLSAQVARGLGDAHRSGVVHRDVKPGNVLVRDSGTDDQHAYLCDFGIARLDSAVDGPTATGAVAGSWAYLAPERGTGAPATPASDLYAVGCLLFACLTGHPPYQGTEVEVALAHARAPVPQLPGNDRFTRELNAVLARALAKDPADRHPDAAALRADLERLAATAPSTPIAAWASSDEDTRLSQVRKSSDKHPGTGPTPPRATTRPRRWPLAVAAVAVLAVVAGGLAWALLAPGDDDGNETAEGTGVTGDLDGDGNGDLLAVQSRPDSGSAVRTWTIPSTGKAFASAREGEARDASAHLADVDGDQAPDRVWLDVAVLDGELTMEVVPAHGEEWSRTFELDPNLFGPVSVPMLADVTGDGMSDLVVYTTLEDTTAVHVAESDGNAVGELEQWYSAQGEDSAPGHVHPGDFDGDGTDEILEVTPSGGEATLALTVLDPREGELVPGDPFRFHGAGWALGAWIPGDVDGDGTDEITVTGGRGRSVGVTRLTDGAFTQPDIWWSRDVPREEWRERLLTEGAPESDLWALSDVDGDGDDDLVRLGEPEDESRAVEVRLAEDESFADPVSWGAVDCGQECEDDFELVRTQ